MSYIWKIIALEKKRRRRKKNCFFFLSMKSEEEMRDNVIRNKLKLR
jgi:hypothetical protein